MPSTQEGRALGAGGCGSHARTRLTPRAGPQQKTLWAAQHPGAPGTRHRVVAGSRAGQSARTEGRCHRGGVLCLVLGALGGPSRPREELDNGLKPEAPARKGGGEFRQPRSPFRLPSATDPGWRSLCVLLQALRGVQSLSLLRRRPDRGWGQSVDDQARPCSAKTSRDRNFM